MPGAYDTLGLCPHDPSNGPNFGKWAQMPGKIRKERKIRRSAPFHCYQQEHSGQFRGRRRGTAMRGRIRIAAAGLASLAIIALSVGTAGAQTPSTYSVTANGGFLSLSLLNNAVQVTGGGSAADAGTATPAGVATSGPYADASGTGLCASLSSTALCPSDATTPLPSGVLLDSTARSNATSTNPTPAAGSAC